MATSEEGRYENFLKELSLQNEEQLKELNENLSNRDLAFCRQLFVNAIIGRTGIIQMIEFDEDKNKDKEMKKVIMDEIKAVKHNFNEIMEVVKRIPDRIVETRPGGKEISLEAEVVINIRVLKAKNVVKNYTRKVKTISRWWHRVRYKTEKVVNRLKGFIKGIFRKKDRVKVYKAVEAATNIEEVEPVINEISNAITDPIVARDITNETLIEADLTTVDQRVADELTTDEPIGPAPNLDSVYEIKLDVVEKPKVELEVKEPEPAAEVTKEEPAPVVEKPEVAAPVVETTEFKEPDGIESPPPTHSPIEDMDKKEEDDIDDIPPPPLLDGIDGKFQKTIKDTESTPEVTVTPELPKKKKDRPKRPGQDGMFKEMNAKCKKRAERLAAGNKKIKQVEKRKEATNVMQKALAKRRKYLAKEVDDSEDLNLDDFGRVGDDDDGRDVVDNEVPKAPKITTEVAFKNAVQEVPVGVRNERVDLMEAIRRRKRNSKNIRFEFKTDAQNFLHKDIFEAKNVVKSTKKHSGGVMGMLQQQMPKGGLSFKSSKQTVKSNFNAKDTILLYVLLKAENEYEVKYFIEKIKNANKDTRYKQVKSFDGVVCVKELREIEGLYNKDIPKNEQKEKVEALLLDFIQEFKNIEKFEGAREINENITNFFDPLIEKFELNVDVTSKLGKELNDIKNVRKEELEDDFDADDFEDIKFQEPKPNKSKFTRN